MEYGNRVSIDEERIRQARQIHTQKIGKESDLIPAMACINNQEIGAPSKGFAINLLDLDIKTLEALTTYAHEQCFTLEEAIVNLIKSALRQEYGIVFL